jgi:hypothetical protein
MRPKFVRRLVALVVLATACTRPPMAVPPAPEPAVIDAPIAAVALAIREELTLRHIDFDLTDTSSVSLVSAPMRMEYAPDVGLVNCGPTRAGHGYAYYRVSLAAAGQQTRLAPRLTFNRRSLGGPIGEIPPEDSEVLGCPSRQVWEADFAYAVKARAEGHPLTIALWIDPAAKPYTALVGGGRYYANVPSCGVVSTDARVVRLYFGTESEARGHGLVRSSAKGC